MNTRTKRNKDIALTLYSTLLRWVQVTESIKIGKFPTNLVPVMLSKTIPRGFFVNKTSGLALHHNDPRP